MKAILAFLFLAAACGAQAATYGELVAARRAGTNIVERPDPARVVARSVLSHTASNALVVAVRLDGTIATNVVHYAMIQGAAVVRRNVSARCSEASEWRRMTVALAAAAGSDTNAVLASSA